MLDLFWKTARAEIRQMLPFHAVVFGYTALVLLLAAWAGVLTGTSYESYAVDFAPIYFVLLPVALLALRLPLALLKRRRGQPVEPESTPVFLGRVAASVTTLATFIVFMGTFTTFKTLMPVLRGGFLYDRVQADIDLFLHGVDPGPALAHLLVNPVILKGIHWNYDVVWMALTFIPVFFAVAGREARGIRLRYLLTFVCVWAILGNLIALLFLSAGPVFYADITGDTVRFAAQMHVLQDQGVWPFRSYLWENYLSGTVGVGTGISAFPSLHVAAAMMNALFLRDMKRIFGLVGFAYVGLIAVSSVLLGWHYAVDGYASILVVWLLHRGLKRAFDERSNDAERAPFLPAPTPAAS